MNAHTSYQDGFFVLDALPEKFDVTGIPEGGRVVRWRCRPQDVIRAYVRRGGRFEEWQCTYTKNEEGAITVKLEFCAGTNFRP